MPSMVELCGASGLACWGQTTGRVLQTLCLTAVPIVNLNGKCETEAITISPSHTEPGNNKQTLCSRGQSGHETLQPSDVPSIIHAATQALPGLIGKRLAKPSLAADDIHSLISWHYTNYVTIMTGAFGLCACCCVYCCRPCCSACARMYVGAS
eukprot:scaffold99807_cov34-Prasinocladus_malaysianus.AAC.1